MKQKSNGDVVIGGTGTDPGTCADKTGFVDAGGYKCTDWVGYDCTRASEDDGYTAAQEASLLANCKKSCNQCSTTTDLCPTDPNKTQPGQCGCGTPDTDSDNDGAANCKDSCPSDPKKTAPGQCGCGVAEGTCSVTCADNASFVDAQGYKCSGWVGYNCTRAAEDYGYTAAQEAAILANCKKTCNQCSTTTDLCPNDPSKTEPGVCGCGVPEGTCGPSSGIKHIATTRVYDPNGQGLTIARPSGSQAGDLLVLFLHRTDGDLPLRVSGWSRAGECLKEDNGYQCSTANECTSWSDSSHTFCDTFAGGLGGHDLGQVVFYKTAGSSEPGSYTFNLNKGSSGEPGWAFLTALRGAATTSPVRSLANKGCDNDVHSKFPSVYGQSGDMLLLSQAFDDAVSQSTFGAPSGTSLFGYVTGERQYVSAADQNSSLENDETGFLYGAKLTSTGDTGTKTTTGGGASSCKDALISLTIKPQ
ncbi:MAG: hypothetical protein MUC50_00335 [Myxococcota bacterium]|nr:hypothetical protein [Myxococcota bacterium]